ncbi:alpha-amylase family glycosyl hydrolase [Mucilaginibacter sp.]
MKQRKLLLFVSLSCLPFGQGRAIQHVKSIGPKNNAEIIYHIFERSFFDSNGDGHGDLNGIYQKLNYLQELGVTAILLTPLYESMYYHNYFATDFYKIDPRYGTMADYLRLIKELHRRHMKFYMDMETQYVASDNAWFRDSYKNPASKYSDYIFYADKANTKPVSIVAGLTDFTGYDGVTRKLIMVNLNNKEVQQFNYNLFKFWMDPNDDGKFDDGVDGFRLDHMMDNLDNANRLPHLFATFWNPLLTKLRTINPKIKIVAEQAEWDSFGIDNLTHGGVDRVFAFRLAFAIRNFNKKELMLVADSTFLQTPANKQQVVFIENHDMQRFADAVKGDPGKSRIGCVLNLLMGGVPSIYYGQELGMKGNKGNFGMTDGNDIPNRQAFEWYKSNEGPGMAYWYKNGPWWTKDNNDIPNDGISLEEEENDPKSLWNFYRKIISLRKNNPIITKGTYANLMNNNDQVFSFMRYNAQEKFIVVVNLSAEKQHIAVDVNAGNKTAITALIGNKPLVSGKKLRLTLNEFGVNVIKIEVH